MQNINSQVKVRERDQTHKIYTDPSSRVASSLPCQQTKKISLITLNCTTYTIKTLSCTLQQTQLCYYLQPCTLQFKIHNIHNLTCYNPL